MNSSWSVPSRPSFCKCSVLTGAITCTLATSKLYQPSPGAGAERLAVFLSGVVGGVVLAGRCVVVWAVDGSCRVLWGLSAD
jgi:hypothetical protein